MKHPETRTDVKTRPRLDEIDVTRLRLIAAGVTNEEIARRTNIPVSTTGRHLTALFTKIGAKDRTHATVIALTSKLIKPTDVPLPTWVLIEMTATREVIPDGG